METTTVQSPSPITGNVLFYDKPEPLSREEHGKLGVSRTDRPFSFAKVGHVVPLTVGEFGFAALSYPIIFGGDLRQPLAVLGINPGENLYIKEDGAYTNGCYVPAYIRRYPFILAEDQAQNRMIVCIERTASIFSDSGFDTPLFDEKGEPSEYTQNAINFCEEFENERRRTESFVKLLTDLDLFETKTALFTPNNPDGTAGEPIQLAEYFGVSEAKLNALPAEKLVELRDNGALERIYNHLTSLPGWDRTVAIASERDAARA